MVSNTLGMDLDDLVKRLKRIRRESAHSPEYRELRKNLPDDWPM